MPIDQKKAHDALQEAIAACGGKWRDIEFHGSIPEHDQMDTPKGRLVLFARGLVFAQQAGIDTSHIKGTNDEKAKLLADRIEDQCVTELGISAWTGKSLPKKRGPSPLHVADRRAPKTLDTAQHKVMAAAARWQRRYPQPEADQPELRALWAAVEAWVDGV